MRISSVSKMLKGINEGYVPFTFGKFYIPTTNEEKSNIISNELKMYLQKAIQIKVEDRDSIYEYLLPYLKDIQQDKDWRTFEVAKEFAGLITKEPPEPPKAEIPGLENLLKMLSAPE